MLSAVVVSLSRQLSPTELFIPTQWDEGKKGESAKTHRLK